MFTREIVWFLVILNSFHIRATPVSNLEKKVVEDTINYRLQKTVLPDSYILSLRLEDDVFSTNKFTGSVTITFKAVEDVDKFNLHSDVIINGEKVALYKVGNNEKIPLNNENFNSDPTTNFVTIEPKEKLTKGNDYRLEISDYVGDLRDTEMYGFYKSSYLDSDNKEHFLATTQFQPVYARRAFPCFDEPIFKATFQIDITYPEKYNAIGNTEGATETKNGLKTTKFKITPRMSTYLIAFIISEFTPTQGDDIEENLKYNVWSREEAKETRQLAVEMGPRLLRNLESFTGIKFSESQIGKMDQVAIPDFAAGAMENWGLITYRENALLWDPKESSNNYMQRVLTVITHEFTHMWFGNWVTTDWWSNTFLNEGFATYFEYHSTAEVMGPTWALDKQFVIKELHPVLQDDSLITSHPLSHEVGSPSEIDERFGSISYNKGGSIFRMVEGIMGKDNFQNGLQNYLKVHQFGNANPIDLWKILHVYGGDKLPNGLELETIMDSWINKAGYPVLTVTSKNNDILIEQERFLLSGENDTKWYVPISYTKSTDTSKFDTTPKAWLLPTESLTIPGILEGTDWIILNNKQTGYYRVNYDDNLWNKLATALQKPKFDLIDELNRAQIVDDLFNFAKHNMKTYNKVFELIKFLEKDESYYPWYAAFNGYSNVLQRTGNDEIRKALSEHILKTMKTLKEEYSFEIMNDDDQIFTLTKVMALEWACKLGDQNCIDKAVTIFNNYKTKKTKPDKNLRSVIYCNALRNSNSVEDWEFLWSEFRKSTIATEQVTIISALGCTKNSDIINRYLQYSITASSGIRRQDALSVFTSVINGNKEGVDIAFDFLIKNYKSIQEYYASMNSLTSMINVLVAKFTTDEQIQKLEKFGETTDLEESLKTAVTTALASAKENLKWTKRIEEQLNAYFDTSTANVVQVKQWLLITLPLIYYYLH